MQEKVTLILIVALEKIDDRFLTQIIFKIMAWKKEMVRSEGNLSKEGRIIQE